MPLNNLSSCCKLVRAVKAEMFAEILSGLELIVEGLIDEAAKDGLVMRQHARHDDVNTSGTQGRLVIRN